eukprot:1156521-Pelagomonas_calceolata.AAC.13
MQSLPQVSGASAGSLLRPGQAACPIFRLPSNTAGSGSCSRSQPQLPGVLPEVAVAKHRRPGQSMKALSLSRKAEDVNGVVTSEGSMLPGRQCTCARPWIGSNDTGCLTPSPACSAQA